jgi:hypothetical protein
MAQTSGQPVTDLGLFHKHYSPNVTFQQIISAAAAQQQQQQQQAPQQTFLPLLTAQCARQPVSPSPSSHSSMNSNGSPTSPFNLQQRHGQMPIGKEMVRKVFVVQKLANVLATNPTKHTSSTIHSTSSPSTTTLDVDGKLQCNVAKPSCSMLGASHYFNVLSTANLYAVNV